MRIHEASLIDEYCRETQLHGKKAFITGFFTKNPDINLTDILESIPTLTDKVHCIFFYENWKKNLGPFDYIRLNTLRSKLYKQIIHRGKRIFSEIVKKDRQGKTFDEIILEKLIPLFIRNEYCILDEIMKHFHSLLDSSSPLKKAHAGLIENIIKIFHIIQFIKEQGGTEETIKQTIDANVNTLKGKARFVLYVIMSRDPYFNPYAVMLKNLLTSVDYSERKLSHEIPEQQRVLLSRLEKIKDVREFVEAADSIVLDCKGYVSTIYENFELLLNEPLVNIYKILKFAGCKQLFHTWITRAPVAVRESTQLEKKVAVIQKELGERVASLTLPVNYRELTELMYCQHIDFTDKYKLLHKTIGTFGDREADACIELCLKHIKTEQFQREKSLLVSTIQKLENIYTMQEISKLFENEKKTIEMKLRSYKKKFRENIKKISEHVKFGIRKVYPEIAELLKRERMLSQALLAFLDRREEQGKPIKLTVDIINFLNNFYIVLNYRIILDFWYQYYTSLVNTDGIFLKQMLSLMTKEALYDIGGTQDRDSKWKIARYKELLEYGSIEKEIREKWHSRLMFSETEEKELSIDENTITLEKYGCSYTIIIKDASGKLLLSKTKTNIRCFLEFLESVKNHKIRTVVAINDRQLKLLYQKAHIDYLDSCMGYVKKRIALLEMRDPISGYSAERINSLGGRITDGQLLKDIVDECRNEFYLRKEILFSLKKELHESGGKEEQRLARINSETKEEVLALRKIDSVFNALRTAVRENNLEIDESLLIIEDIPLPLLEEEKSGEADRETDTAGKDDKKGLRKIEKLKRDNIECVLMNSRIRENIQIIKRVKARLEQGEQDETGDIRAMLEKMPELEVLDIPEEIFYSIFRNIEDAEACVRDIVAARTIEEACGFLENLANRATVELDARQDYIYRHEKQDDITVSIVYYEKELEAQRERVELLHQFRGILIERIKRLRRKM
ncbi:MAG: hypothetical protein JW881_13785 [Spirochaetales bacterium]|nr:hypothetical protein [Spirochaetales bacterium]